jgi:hypothetical protein
LADGLHPSIHPSVHPSIHSHKTRLSIPPSNQKQTLRVTQIEAERLEESREERARFLANLRAEVERQAAAKGVAVRLPPPSADEVEARRGGGEG